MVGSALAGRVTAHVVPDPGLPDLAALRGRVDAGEFAGTSPLVVGGSRGLGAVACRLLALGGAEPLVGWSTEPGPADDVVAEVHAAGGRATAVRIDVRDTAGAVAALDAAGWEGDVVLPFATPRILRRHLGGDRPELLEELREVHVDGVIDLLVALRRRRPGRPLVVGYPSSVAVDEPPDDMREYARAGGPGGLRPGGPRARAAPPARAHRADRRVHAGTRGRRRRCAAADAADGRGAPGLTRPGA